VTALPAIFPNLKDKYFTLLWRGSRDGFDAEAFHIRCDGHSNTLTLIQDTGGFIFGGFTPVPWESQPFNEEEEDIDDTIAKADESGRSFLFTLRNPYALPPKKFPLYRESRKQAILCSRKRGPMFGADDLLVDTRCNENTTSRTRGFGSSYSNGTGRDGKTFFTGMAYFTVKEIEVFEVSG
jgi:hypothetical protein